MRVLLISANTEQGIMPVLPLGLGCVAAAAQAAGHAVHFLDLLRRENPIGAVEEALAAFRPQVIGISIRNIDDQESRGARFLLEGARPVVAACRRGSAAPVVLGGAGYSLFPQAVLDDLGADMGIRGEGEVAFPLLLQVLDQEGDLDTVPGLYRRGRVPLAPRAYAADLDRLPWPGPDLFDPDLADNPQCWLPVQTRRGCPLRCSYCSTPGIEGTRIRKRAPEAVVALLARWRAAGYRRVFFVDNTFNLPPAYARELCRCLATAGLDLTWHAIVYPGRLDPDLVRAMARAGCREVSLGFESGSPLILDAMHKRFGPEDIRRASRLLAAAGIWRMGFLMLGGPGETRSTVEESLAFVDALRLEAVKITVGVRIYPETELAAHAVQEGIIRPDDDLLRPRFYITPGLEDWLRATAAEYAARRDNCIL